MAPELIDLLACAGSLKFLGRARAREDASCLARSRVRYRRHIPLATTFPLAAAAPSHPQSASPRRSCVRVIVVLVPLGHRGNSRVRRTESRTLVAWFSSAQSIFLAAQMEVGAKLVARRGWRDDSNGMTTQSYERQFGGWRETETRTRDSRGVRSLPIGSIRASAASIPCGFVMAFSRHTNEIWRHRCRRPHRSIRGVACALR